MKPAATNVTVPGPHPACLDDDALARQCRVTFGRGSGPGGQHRNKVETAAFMTHEPTGITATATERRSQSQNRHTARGRLRIKLAITVRTTAVVPGCRSMMSASDTARPEASSTVNDVSILSPGR